MNREIKFRACISPKTIIHFTLQDLADPVRYHLFSFRELLLPWLRDGNKPDEYTGPKDKDGKEIFEGDIVTHDDANDPCIISYDDDNARFVASENIYTGYDLTDGTSPLCKVIGNIYSDKELIE